jgi:CBS domain-containing protein
MRVKELMTGDPLTCAPTTSAAEAAHLMWEGDCGILPVVDAGKLVGVVTDRDMYIALATQNKQASQLTVGAVATRTVSTCEPEDDISTALTTMRTARVRRLPVVGFGGTVLGILSLNDIVRAAGPRKSVRSDEVIGTLQAICGPHHPVAPVVAV